MVDLGDHVFVHGEVITSPARRAVGAGRPLGDGGQGAAPAAGRAPAELSEETRVRQRYVDLIVRPQAREMVRTRAHVVRTLRDVLHDRGLRRGRDADAAAAARRGDGAAVRHPRERARHRSVPADRAGAVPQALRGRRHRAGLRDQSQLPQRGHRLVALAGVRDARGLPGVRRPTTTWPSSLGTWCRRAHGPCSVRTSSGMPTAPSTIWAGDGGRHASRGGVGGGGHGGDPRHLRSRTCASSPPRTTSSSRIPGAPGRSSWNCSRSSSSTRSSRRRSCATTRSRSAR